MSIFRGPKEGTLPDGSVVATQGDIAEALTASQQAQAAAEAAQSAAESTLDDFDDRYLGAKSSDPTVDNDGDALIDGALYYNTGTNITKVYEVSSGQWFNVKPTDSEQTNINTVAGIAVDVETVSNSISDVQEVSSNLSGTDTIGTVAGSISNVDATGNNISSVNTVAGELGAGLDVTVVASDLEGTDTIGTVANSISDVNTAADNITAIQNAPQFASDAEDAQGYAEEWAIKTEDTPVSVDAGGDGTNDFSALHHAAKASASASAASTSESNALTSEQNAATSESNALTSEQNASQSESNAATSEQNAQQAATEAETALDNFTDQYLGAKSTEPSTDNDGDPLVTGAIYYDTTDEQLYIWDGSNWEGAAFSASGTVLSFNGRDGVVTLRSSDVTGALGFTPEDSATAYDSLDFTTDFASETTDNLSEGTSNLYYTDTRARNALAASGDISYDSATGTFSFTETPNYTDADVDAHLSGGSGIEYSSGTISHSDTSAQGSVNNSGTTVIQDVTLDGFGHVTALGSTTLSIPNAANNATITLSPGSGLDGGGSFTTDQSSNETITFTIESDLRGDVTQIGPSTSDYYVIGSTTHDWHLDGNLDMRLENDGDLHVDGDVVAFSTTTSDARLKTNVGVVKDALDKVSQIRGVEFEYIDDGRKSAGVIAQELETVLPNAVRENTVLARTEQGDNTLYKTVQYDQLHALLIESIKDLATKVEDLEKKISSLGGG